MKWRIILVLTVIATLSSCIFTFHPLYSDDILVDIPGLEGAFMDTDNFMGIGSDESSEWTFTKTDKGTYNLQINEPQKSGTMEVHAVRLGGEYFLDFRVVDGETDNVPEFIQWHLLPMHSFAKVYVYDDRLELMFIDIEWAEENLEKHRIRIDHETRRHNNDTEYILLTASTRDLQKFVAKYARFDEAFEDPDVMPRVSEQ